MAAKALLLPKSLSFSNPNPKPFINPNPNLLHIPTKPKPPISLPPLKSTSISQPNQVVTTPPNTRVRILSEALPFIQKFRNKTTVVKYGWAAMKSGNLQAFVIADLVLLSCVGIRIVFVHGGGPEINHWLTRLGIKPNFLNGLRVTDASTMEVVSMVLIGKVNKMLVSLINKAGATAVGLSGIDGRLLTASPAINVEELGL